MNCRCIEKLKIELARLRLQCARAMLIFVYRRWVMCCKCRIMPSAISFLFSVGTKDGYQSSEPQRYVHGSKEISKDNVPFLRLSCYFLRHNAL